MDQQRIKALEEALSDALGCWEFDGVSDQHEAIFLRSTRVLENPDDEFVDLTEDTEFFAKKDGYGQLDGYPLVEEEFIIIESVGDVATQKRYRRTYNTT